jgi:hypothetical protein
MENRRLEILQPNKRVERKAPGAGEEQSQRCDTQNEGAAISA